jgi:CheY-like chemotaxis protein
MTQETVKVFIVDDDPIFRLGFCTALNDFPDFQVIGQSDNARDTSQKLAQGLIPELLILELALGHLLPSKESGWKLCQKLHRQYPQLPIFLLTSETKTKELLKAQALGIKGYCSKRTAIPVLINALRLVARGGAYWQTDSFPPPSFWQTSLVYLKQSGIQQIKADLYKINGYLDNHNLSTIDRLFWFGRRRELLLAQWLVDRIAYTPDSVVNQNVPLPKALPEGKSINYSSLEKLALSLPTNDSPKTQIFQAILNNISLGLINNTKITLEIDILQLEKQQQLLYLIVEHLIELLAKFDNLDNREKLLAKLDKSIAELWETVAINFFFRNYNDDISIEEDEVRELFRQDAIAVSENIFIDIYYRADLFVYLVKEQPILVDNILYRPESPEAMAQVEKLLQNLLIHLANGVMYSFLNTFYDLETFKYTLYSPQFRTSREIARFRNSLSWRYRQERYWENPTNIFTSRYRLFIWQQQSIETYFVYAPRTEELEELNGLPWLTTILLELRDATAPLLRSILALLGSGLVYLLTEVVGRGIGLIGKGVIQGIGNSFQNTNYPKDREEKTN